MRHPLPLLVTFVLGAGIAVGALGVAAGPATAQGAKNLPAPPRAGSAAMHRTRAVAAWKRYVWTLDRPLLAQVVADLEAELRKTETPAEFTAELLLAHGYVMLARPEQAMESLTRAEKIAPNHAGIVLIQGLMAVSERSEDALMLLDRYLDRIAAAPRDRAFGTELLLLGHLHRGALHMRHGRHDAAAKDLTRAVEICREAKRDPPGPLVQRLARAHQALGEYARAEELVRQLLVRDPADALNYLNMGVLFYEQDRFDEARKWYEAAIARKATYSEPHLRLAYLASVAGDLPRLRRHVETFERLATKEAGDAPIPSDLQVEIDAAYGGYWRARASRLQAAGADEAAAAAYRRARERLDAALKVRRHCLRALTLRVQVAAQTGEDRLEELRELLDAVQSQDEDTPEAYRGVFC